MVDSLMTASEEHREEEFTCSSHDDNEPKNHNDDHEDDDAKNRIMMEELIELENPMQLAPMCPNKCPLFCCFYAEFDIKKGPVVKFQCPQNFMDQDINIPTLEIHEILSKAFQSIETNTTRSSSSSRRRKKQKGATITVDKKGKSAKDSSDDSIIPSVNDTTDDEKASTQKSPEQQGQPDGTFSKKEEEGKEKEKNDDQRESIGIRLPEGGQSIFDSTSEYIITGNELTGKIITLSTHDMHVMTRPTQIEDERYERNALFFSIGFVLRRAADPRPFRSLISKLAMTLRSMEIESGLLSNRSKINRIQPLLEQILIAMNSPRWECNLLLDRSTALNLKLFHPPKPQASIVHEYQVPILLRRDLQLQMYEWDLAINWVILHIDGITTARQISIKAEVDLEMVLACLRVLKHHDVISIVDMFMYTNRYEFTEKAAAMLAGKEGRLLREAVEFVMKRPTVHVPAPHSFAGAALTTSGGASTLSGGSETGYTTGGSPKLGSPHFPSSVLGPATPSSSYPPRTFNMHGAGSHRSSNFRFAIMAASSLEREAASCLGSRQHEERRHLKVALAELYCACNRNLSFGDLWLSLTTELPTSLVLPVINKAPALYRGSTLSSTQQRNTSSRKSSICEVDTSDHDVVALSPLEASLLESMKLPRSGTAADEKSSNINSKNSKSSSPPNWNEIFKQFDHRRFFSFGVVRGLLIRVHSYPFFSGSFPERRNFSWNDPALLKVPTESKSRQPINFKREILEENFFQLAKSAAHKMDGTRCDDELVCTFEKPFNQLVDLVEKYSGKKVVHIYATASS